jgi:L-2-amino-thiazoline-4-carboxylic acid hydrolase-like protein
MSETRSSVDLDCRKRRILRAFDKRVSHYHRALEGRFDARARDDIVAAARSKLEQLAGEIPYAGQDRNPMAANIIGPYTFLCFALVLRQRGCTTEEIGAFVHASYTTPFSWLPQWLLRRLRRPMFWLTFRRMAAVADASQRREHADEFVLAVPTPPPGADFALEIRDCAVCKAFAKHGEQSVVPYVCATDDLMSDAFGLGLRRTGTRAVGAERCDFVYEFDSKPLRLQDQYDLAQGKRLTKSNEQSS